MNIEYVRQRIEKIRSLVSEARYDEAFQDLEGFIAEMDGEEVEEIRERDLLDQLISVKSRYNFFKQQVLKGIQEGQSELNQIAAALLALTNEVKKVGEEKPHIFKPASEEEEKEIYAEMAATAPLTAIENLSEKDLSQNSGCLLAINNKNANVNVEIKDFNWTGFFIKLLVGLGLVFGLIFFLMKGCNENTEPVGPLTPPIVNPGGEGKEPDGGTDTIAVEEPGKETVRRGKDCAELGLASGQICDLANYVSDSENKLSKRFELDRVAFNANSLGLNGRGQAQKQIDDLVTLLKAYPGLDITIYGYIAPNEEGVVKGVNGKEDGLDNVRAKKIFGLLKSRGIDSKRMEHIGDTENDRGDTRIWIKME